MKKNYSDLTRIVTTASLFLKEKTKFSYACERIIARIKSAIKKDEEIYQEKVIDARVDLASVDDKGNLLLEGGNYKFTKDNMKTLNANLRKLADELNSTEYEIESFIATDIPELTFEQMDLFKGILISENYETQLLEKIDG